MFGKRITLFRLFGIAVRADFSWVLVAALVAWSLAVGAFPKMAPGLEKSMYWGMGIAGAVLLFLSIVTHELAHALVARRYGVPMKGITLFLFGGVAEMSEEPRDARSELLMALAGPATSLALSGVFFVILAGARGATWPPYVTGVVWYLAFINLVLVGFNMIPAFPLDGGRVLRAALWMWKGDLRRATRIAAGSGSIFGVLLIILGIVSIFTGNLIGGIWWFLIGMFVRNAASMSYSQVVVREMLRGQPIARFMNPNPVTVQRSASIGDLVENYVYRYHHKMFPVLDGDRLVGCVTTRMITEVPRDEWARQTVGTLAGACRPENRIAPDADALEALMQMMRANYSRLMVVEGEQLVGVISLKDLMNFLRLKLELEDGSSRHRAGN